MRGSLTTLNPQKKLTQEAPYYCCLYEAQERRLLIKLSQNKVVTESPIPIQLPIYEELQGAEATNNFLKMISALTALNLKTS